MPSAGFLYFWWKSSRCWRWRSLALSPAGLSSSSFPSTVPWTPSCTPWPPASSGSRWKFYSVTGNTPNTPLPGGVLCLKKDRKSLTSSTIFMEMSRGLCYQPPVYLQQMSLISADPHYAWWCICKDTAFCKLLVLFCCFTFTFTLTSRIESPNILTWTYLDPNTNSTQREPMQARPFCFEAKDLITVALYHLN